MAAQQPKVNPAFRDFLPKRTEQEFAELRQSIIDDGVLSPLVLDKLGNILDGHGRWEIIQELKLKAKVVVIDRLETVDDKKAWMARNQIGRRNLTKEQRDYYMGIRAAHAMKEHGGVRRSSGHDVHLKTETVESIAEQEEVSVKTVRRNVDYSAGIEALPPKVKEVVLAGKSDISKKEIIAGPVFCPKCSKMTIPYKDCQQCAALRDQKKAKENEAKRKEEKNKPKSGAMKADWAKLDTDYGYVLRFLDRMADGYQLEKNKGIVEDIRNTLKSFHRQLMDLKKTLTKGEG